MENSAQNRTEHYIHMRQQHPAWQLLASRRAPLVLACLQTLFEQAHDGIAVEDAMQALADMLGAHANNDDYQIEPENTHLQAGRELRSWIKRNLVIEREGKLFATDALAMAMQFASGLDNRMMTSTASRLSVVQREIENLEVNLNPNVDARISSLKSRIQLLEKELQSAQSGHITVLDNASAAERIREVYSLATGLRADFRRVEDSWRSADKALRQSIISEQYHRGDIIDRLLDGQDALLDTPEGRVFDSFQEQLRQATSLATMKAQLRSILKHPACHQALDLQQLQELRWLVIGLVKESQAVFRARARSEKDVQGFLKTGLAAEHHRVGNLLAEVMSLALQLDWPRQACRRQSTPLPPLGVALAGLPIVERLRFKSLEDTTKEQLNLQVNPGDLAQLDDAFWQAFDGLDRDTLVADTLALLAEAGQPLTLAQLASQLPPSHDLETFALWLAMAREAGITIDESAQEHITLSDDDGRRWQFSVPATALNHSALKDIIWEL